MVDEPTGVINTMLSYGLIHVAVELVDERIALGSDVRLVWDVVS